MDDKDAVKAVMTQLSAEALDLLQQVLALEKQNLHIPAADLTDALVQKVKGLV